MKRDRGLVAATAALGLCGAAFSLLDSDRTLGFAAAAALAFGAFLAVWIYRDSENSGWGDARGWAAAAALAWPLALPCYLVMTRGLRGLLLAAGILLAFFMLPFSFLAAILREQGQAARLIEEGRALYLRAGHDDPAIGKIKALRVFERAARVHATAWDAYYMIFVTAFETGHPEIAAEHFGKLQALDRADSFAGASAVGRHLAAIHYSHLAHVYHLENAGRALYSGRHEAFRAEVKSLLLRGRDAREVEKACERFAAELTPEDKTRYAEELAQIADVREDLRRLEAMARSAASLSARMQSAPQAQWAQELERVKEELAALRD